MLGIERFGDRRRLQMALHPFQQPPLAAPPTPTTGLASPFSPGKRRRVEGPAASLNERARAARNTSCSPHAIMQVAKGPQTPTASVEQLGALRLIKAAANKRVSETDYVLEQVFEQTDGCELSQEHHSCLLQQGQIGGAKRCVHELLCMSCCA